MQTINGKGFCYQSSHQQCHQCSQLVVTLHSTAHRDHTRSCTGEQLTKSQDWLGNKFQRVVEAQTKTIEETLTAFQVEPIKEPFLTVKK